MDLRTPDSLNTFLATAVPFLIRHEAEHGLMIGVAAEATRAMSRGSPRAYQALVTEGDAVVGAALRTADRLLLSREGRAGAMALVAEDAMRRVSRNATRAVLGPTVAVDAFAAAASSVCGAVWREGMAQRVYEVRAVVPPHSIAGARRSARPDDRDLLAAWTCAFNMEAAGERVRDDAARASVARRIADGSLHVWEVQGQVVASAAAVGPTPRGIRINGVYTPSALRGRGYASALVASLSQHQLDAGREFVFLHADLANPTANAIYQRIGYRAVGDKRLLWLEGSA